MRGKDYNTGLRGVLFEARHYARMGAALWLYGWLVLRQTHQDADTGWVLGGAAVSYREIEQETGFNPRTLERWMRTLRNAGYIETEAAPDGVVIRITKAKKFRKAPEFPQGVRSSADALRKAAEARTHVCVAKSAAASHNTEVAAAIGSSSVERYKKDPKQPKIHNVFHSLFHNPPLPGLPAERHNRNQNPSGLGETRTPNCEDYCNYNPETGAYSAAPFGHAPSPEPTTIPLDARLLRRLLRREREEEVRRELAVGTGPEVQRT